MPGNMASNRIMVIMILCGLLFGLVILSGIAYALLLRPQHGDRYADIFFMVSFVGIIALLMFIYYVWVERDNGGEE